MSESDTGEIVQTEAEAEIERAYHVENDPAKANRLYQKLIGSTDREGEISPAPVVDVPDEAKAESIAEPAGPSPGDVDQGMGGGGMADYVSIDALTQDEQDTAYDGMMSLCEPGVTEGILKRDWPGAEYDRNREFGDAVLMSNSYGAKALRVLELAGVVDHPDLVRFIVETGRALANKPGDPSSISITTRASKQMVNMNTAQIEAKIDTLQDDIERAQARNDDTKAQAAYEQQQALYRLLPGGGDPIIGSQGRTL